MASDHIPESTALEAFREYDEMVQNTIQATERANALRDELFAARTWEAPPDPTDDVTLSVYNYGYLSPLSRRTLSTPPVWRGNDGPPLPTGEVDGAAETFGTLSRLSSSSSSSSLRLSPHKKSPKRKSPRRLSPHKASPKRMPAQKFSPQQSSPQRSPNKTQQGQRQAADRLSGENIAKANSSAPLDPDLLRYRPLVQGDSVCGETLVYGFAGSSTINAGLQKRLPRKVGLNSRLTRALSGKLHWGRAYVVLDPGPELLACYASRTSSKAIKIIRLRGAHLLSVGRKKRKEGENSLPMFCWIIKEAGSSEAFTFGVPSSDIARMWTHSLRYTITQQQERDSLLEQRQRQRDDFTRALSSPKDVSNRFKVAPLANSWEMSVHDVEHCVVPQDIVDVLKSTDNTVPHSLNCTTASFLKEMGFAVVQDLYKGRIIGMTLGSIKEQAAVRIQTLFRGNKERSHLAKRRGKKGAFTRKRSAYHQALEHGNTVPMEVRHLRPKVPYVLSVHMERLLAFAPRTSRNAARKIQSMVRGFVTKKAFMEFFTIQRNVCCSIQGWYRLYTKRWLRKQVRSAIIIQRYVRRWIAQCQLDVLRIDAWDFIRNKVVCSHLVSCLDVTISRRVVCQWMRMQVCLLRMRRWRRSVKTIKKFWLWCVGSKLRQLFRTAVKAIVRVQAISRRIQQVKTYRETLGDATFALRKIIRWWRSHRPRMAARSIQSVWRMYIGARPFHAAKRAAVILATRYRGWTCQRSYGRALAAAVVIESATRRMIANRQVRFNLWQIVKIQTQFRVRKARLQLKMFQKDLACRHIQSWYRGLLAMGDYAKRREAEIYISRWWTGMCLLSKIHSVVCAARYAATVIQTSVRALLAREHDRRQELSGLQEFVDLETSKFSSVIRVTGFSVKDQPSSRRAAQTPRHALERFASSGERGRGPAYVAVARFSPTSLSLDRMLTTAKRRGADRGKTEETYKREIKEMPAGVRKTTIKRVGKAVWQDMSWKERYEAVHLKSPALSNAKPDVKTEKKPSFAAGDDKNQRSRWTAKPVQLVLSQIPHLMTTSVTLRELSLAVLVHPWLRRHRLGVQQLIQHLAATPQLYQALIVVQGTGNDDMSILNSTTSQNKTTVLVSALEKDPIRLPRSIAACLLKLGYSQVSQMTVEDFMKHAGAGGERENELRNASQRFMNGFFTTDLRQMQADLRQTTLETLTDSRKRSSFDLFLRRMHTKFGKTYQVFNKLNKVGTNLLVGFETNKKSLQGLQVMTQPPHLIHRVTKRMSNLRTGQLTASDSFAVHDDAGAYFLTKQLVDFVDAFVALGPQWDTSTPNKCHQLATRVYALVHCIPDRYRRSHDFQVTSKIVALDGALGSVHFGRESFVPIFLESLDILVKLGAVQSCWQNVAEVKEEETKHNAEIAQLSGMRHCTNKSDSDISSFEEEEEEASVATASTNQEEDEMTADLYSLLEHETTRMSVHLSNIQNYVSPIDFAKLKESLSSSMPVGAMEASFNFSVQMQSVLTNWIRDCASKMDSDHPKFDFLLRVPFQMAALHAVMELWETAMICPPDQDLTPAKRSHMDTQFISIIIKLLDRLRICLDSIDVHQQRCAAQQKRCMDYMKWVHDEKKRCVMHCVDSRKYMHQCQTKHDQAAHVVDVASTMLIAPLERPDGVDEKRIIYFKSAVVMNSAAYQAANVELAALDETLQGIQNSNNDCNTSLDRIATILEQQRAWLEHSRQLYNGIMLRLASRAPRIQDGLHHVESLATQVEAVDRVQLVRVATRSLDDFEMGERRRDEILATRETWIHDMRAQSRGFRKHCRDYLVKMWFALEKNVSWYWSWEQEFQIKLNKPCTEVEAKISVLYDQVEQAKQLNQEKVDKLREEAEERRAEWHDAEKTMSNFWWHSFTEKNCAWFSKWKQWHHGIRLEKKVFEDKRREEVKLAKIQEAVVETQQAAVSLFRVGDTVEAKCKGWHQWWVGEVRRVDDPVPGSGKFTYFLKFQDGERIRGVEERRVKEPMKKPEHHLFGEIEESIAATSDYTNDSLGNPGSEESDFYFETDSDIAPADANEDMQLEHEKERADNQKEKEKRKKKKQAKRQKKREQERERKQKMLGVGNDEQDSDGGTGDEMSDSDNFESSSEEEEEEEEVDPLQIILDRAIEFIMEYPNAGRYEIPWEKLFTDNSFVYNEWEAERLYNRYNFKKQCYYPVEKVEKKADEEGETKSVGSIPSTDGYGPLLIAAHKGNFDKVRTIVNSGGDINMVADDGETPLIAAARNGHEDVVRLLAELGANVNKVKTSKEGEQESAALAARRGGHEHVVELLYEFGAKHVPRLTKEIKWFGHRKIDGMEVSETESERSSDRHSWDLDEDHPLDFDEIFKPVSLRRKEKKDKRRKEKIAQRMKEIPLSDAERKTLIFSSRRRTALQQWDTIESHIHDAADDARTLTKAMLPPFKHDKWDRHAKQLIQDPIKLLPTRTREKLLSALKDIHHLRLAVEWRDQPAAQALATEMLVKLVAANVPTNEAGGVMQFAGGVWDILEPNELSVLSQIASITPAIEQMLIKLQSRYDDATLEPLAESNRVVSIGQCVDPAIVDATDVRRLVKIFDRLSVLPAEKTLSAKEEREKAKHAKMKAEAGGGEEKQTESATPPTTVKLRNKTQILAEKAEKLAAASREEKVLDIRTIAKAVEEFKRIPCRISTATMRYFVRHRYESRDGSITWEQFVDCATTKLKSRFQIRKMYHTNRVSKARLRLQARLLTWARKITSKIYLKLPHVKQRVAATRIQNWFRGLHEYYGFLKQRYVFDTCKKVNEAALTIANMFWRKCGSMLLRERVARDFVMVYDPESQGIFYCDQTTMRTQMHLPPVVRGVLREYSEESRFKNIMSIRALRPWQLNEKATQLQFEKKLREIAAKVQQTLEKTKGKYFHYEELCGIIDASSNNDGVIEVLTKYRVLEVSEELFMVSYQYHEEIDKND